VPSVASFLLLVLPGHALADKRVRLIGEFAQQQQIVAAEAVGVVELLLVVDVRAGELHVVERPLIRVVFPDGRLDATKPEGFGGAGATVRRGIAGRSGCGRIFCVHGLHWLEQREQGSVARPARYRAIPEIGYMTPLLFFSR